MTTLRLSLSCAFLLSLGTLAGCASGPARPPRSHTARGGFSVLVDGPDHPASARVLADIGAYAQRRGFVRQPARPGPPVDPVTGESLPAAPQLYLLGSVEMEVSYQPTTHRVSAYLHSGNREHDRRFIGTVYHDFDREYGPRYGGGDPISETGFVDDSGPTVQERPAGSSVTGPGGGQGGIDGPGGHPGPGGF